MARWLVADNPVQFWTEGQLVPGYLYHRGNWVEGRGYFTGCTTGWGKIHGMGWLQLDGTFCTASPSSDYFRDVAVHDDAVRDGTDKVLLSEGARGSGFYEGDAYWLMGGLKVGDWEHAFAFHQSGMSRRRSLMRATDDATENLLSMNAGRVQTNLTTTGSWADQTGDVWDPLPTDPDYCNITWKGGDEFYIFHKTGQGAIYNHNTRSIVRNDLWIDDLSSFNRTYTSYCREHDLFIVICKENLTNEPTSSFWDPYFYRYSRTATIRVYLNKGKPASLSLPIALTPLQVGVVSQIEVTVQGAQSDGVEGHLVDWSITAGEGQLTLTQSVTDNEGKATTGYLPPATSGGDVTIEAKVVY